MTLIDAIGSQPGRVLRVAAGGALIGWGLRRGDVGGRLAAAVGVVPLAAGATDVCLLGPLVHGPLNGSAFRQQRAQRQEVSHR